MSHAASFTADLVALFRGPHAAKRMAREYGWPLSTCLKYLARTRAMSLDAAIEAAAKNDSRPCRAAGADRTGKGEA